MPIVVIGLNHKTSPLWMREALSFCLDGLKDALRELKDSAGVQEVCLLSTCNRTEFYMVADSVAAARAAVSGFAGRKDVDWDKFRENFYELHDHQAVEHLFAVTAGLDAMVVGEKQIMGQVRDALLLARSMKAAGPELIHLFAEAGYVGKRVHAETSIADGEVSVATIAVEHARRFFGSIKERSALILGAGEMSELTARCLSGNGIETILVANRSMEKAMKIAHTLGARAVSWNEFTEQLKHVDIVISSTAAPHPLIKESVVRSVMTERNQAALFIVDLAIPRDVEPGVADIPNVYLANIDDLQQIAAENQKQRESHITPAMAIIREEAARYA